MKCLFGLQTEALHLSFRPPIRFGLIVAFHGLYGLLIQRIIGQDWLPFFSLHMLNLTLLLRCELAVRCYLYMRVLLSSHDRLEAEYVAPYQNGQKRRERSMALKASFANVLRALRSKRNITQRDFADTTSRTYLSKLELGKSSITLDKLEQISNRLELSPLTLLTLTLSEDTGRSASDLMSKMRAELDELQHDGGLPGLSIQLNDSSTIQLSGRRPPRAVKPGKQRSMQSELVFTN